LPKNQGANENKMNGNNRDRLFILPKVKGKTTLEVIKDYCEENVFGI